jgi:prepilin peptidase CpaA
VHAPAASSPTVTTLIFVVLMVVAAVLDLRSRRIPNVVTVAGIVAGLALRVPLGLDAVGSGLLGLLLAVPAFALGALGGGDVKLLAGVGAFMGPRQLVGACLLIALLGGVVALVESIRKGALRELLLNVYYMVMRLLSTERRQLAPTLTSPSVMTIPYAVPIAVGALAWWFWGGYPA